MSTTIKRTSVYRGDCLLTAHIPEPEPLLSTKTNPPFSILTMPSMVEIFGQTGTGKSMIATALTLALGTGSDFLGLWKVPTPRRVLYIDGEMPGGLIVSRLRDQAKHMGLKPGDLKDIAFMARDWHKGTGKNAWHRLDTKEGQINLAPFLSERWDEEDEQDIDDIIAHAKKDGDPQLLAKWDAEIIIFDNAITLFDPAAELDALAWQPGQEFLRNLRERGKTSVLVHHSGRAGDDGRGHSSRDDLMDTIIRLKHRPDWTPEKGCDFNLSFKKGRALHGPSAGEMKVKYTSIKGWETSPLKKPATVVDINKYKNSFGPKDGPNAA